MRSIWTVITIALLLGFAAVVTGKWSTHYLLMLVVLILVGALYPPAGVLIGGTALVWVLLAGKGAPFFSQNLAESLRKLGQIFQ